MEDLARRFGRLVALHRKTKRWTQEQLAEVAKLSHDMLAKI
jgi:transcriptional regulator with XRE-family HTH domain